MKMIASVDNFPARHMEVSTPALVHNTTTLFPVQLRAPETTAQMVNCAACVNVVPHPPRHSTSTILPNKRSTLLSSNTCS